MSILLLLVGVYFYQVLMCFVALSISSSTFFKSKKHFYFWMIPIIPILTFWIYKPIYNFINDIKTGFLELK